MEMLAGGTGGEERCNPCESGSQKRTHNSTKSSHILMPEKRPLGGSFSSGFSSRGPGEDQRT